MRTRRVKSVKDELIKKSREAMLAAVQIYNNPQITFKTESFITLTIIAWTYLMHSYYRNNHIDYAYFKMHGKRKKYDHTKNGAIKFWGLECCINNDKCPLDSATKNNLRFLIGIRHEIEHQMTNSIDEFLSAKIQACAINYDFYIQKLFGVKYGVSKELSLSIQFSEVTPEQQKTLTDNDKLTTNIRNYISTFENDLSDDDIKNSRYAYRILFVEINANRKGQADRVIEFVKPDSSLKEEIDRILIKETEKNKYLPSNVVSIMQQEGFTKFKMYNHTTLWKSENAKDPNKHLGVLIAKTWFWYDAWLQIVRKHCQDNASKYQLEAI